MNSQQLKVFWLLLFWVCVIALAVHLAADFVKG